MCQEQRFLIQSKDSKGNVRDVSKSIEEKRARKRLGYFRRKNPDLKYRLIDRESGEILDME